MVFLLNDWQEGCAGAFKMGAETWCQLSGLLLGANADHVCRGRDEPARNGFDNLADVEKYLPLESTVICKAVGVVFLAWVIFLLIN